MWTAIIAIVSLAIGVALTFRPIKRINPIIPPFEAPTAQEGLTIPVLFGTRNFKNPNVVWFGDVKTMPVKGTHVTSTK